ncbi:hypothetical protein BKA66DRAFT_444056 [Pyrenochaeta sp. MPI-SDFR-AT-0127]|nr:hypothetical protein BKA66DRAFT_444056 [Pyrenochaeta sp. MPI-SDFR-AT-0127]
MYLVAFLFTMAVATSAAPAGPSFAEMQSAFASSEQCMLPISEPSCSGSPRSDIILTYSKDSSAASKALLLNAAKAAGGDIVHEWKDFGISAYVAESFSGFVPDGVVDLLKAHSDVANVKIHENACLSVPICGEGPC